DHSKFYVMDGEVLFLGGINIEDKENGRDHAGRAYRDYMVRIDGAQTVKDFLDTLKAPERSASGLFGMNVKRPKRYFGMEKRYLDLIRSAEKELTVVMAYFSPIPAVMREILAAAARGAEVRILCPAHANFQDSLNKSTLNRLKRKSRGKIRIFLSPCMLHTKLLMTEKEVTFGSCNITKKAFRQLDELNLFLPREDPAVRALAESVEADFAEAGTEVTGHLDCHAARGFLESFLV
ncbi:MAG: phosphatidylserine/phosphatidylglycerophosphate/cardiolipin synthase family protein, partial [Lachnospiraceae bacterium]|nr:phosphatidylserine/phosphatidylglycerophosphate/cardiolipin synthase family protein [Lachnospiraceae bacterium]